MAGRVLKRLVEAIVEPDVGQDAIRRVHRYAVVRNSINATHSHRIQRFRQQLCGRAAFQFIFGQFNERVRIVLDVGGEKGLRTVRAV